MARVKIKHKNAKDRKTKSQLLQTLALQHIYVTRIIELHDGLVVLTKTNEDTDKILSKEVSKELKKKNFDPITPPEIKAKRSVILTRLDDYIYKNTKEDLRQELIANNLWIQDEDIEEVFKFPNSNTVKIIFTQASTAKVAKDNGVLMCSMSVPPTQIKEETFIPITTCMRCYALEDHLTNQCPQPKDYKICSECGDSGHTWQGCKNTNKKCINCIDNHRTMAMRCPKRKKIYKQREKQSVLKTTFKTHIARLLQQIHPHTHFQK